MREGGDWIIYLFAILFAVHATITTAILIYRLNFTKEVRQQREQRRAQQAKSETPTTTETTDHGNDR